ncbi:MAG: DUF5723 family protein, partial [Marinirhabdus sp.]|nr:DUF5723 family protein [Marinirhabdus sp.]
VCDCTNKGSGADWAQGVGAQLYSVLRPRGPEFAGTLYYRRKFNRFVSAKATYTVDAFSFSNVGFGLVVDVGRLNAYVAVDNVLFYGNIARAKSVSLQLGFNIKIDER